MKQYKQAIIVRKDLNMGIGKTGVQVAHASVEVLAKANESVVKEWKEQGMKKIALKVGSKKELLELFELAKKKFPTALVKDAGLTQIKPGEPTCIAIGPADEADLDKLTGKLKLL